MLDAAAGWSLAAVSDGGGSYSLARVGSHLIVAAAITAAKGGLEAQVDTRNTLKPPEIVGAIAIAGAVAEAIRSIDLEVAKRSCSRRDLSATLLLVAHHPESDTTVSFQAGDGLIVGFPPKERGGFRLLGTPDEGPHGGETEFLVSRDLAGWMSKIEVFREERFDLIVLASDGLGDDCAPYSTNLPSLESHLRKCVVEAEPEARLLDLIGYQKRGSADDRSIAVLANWAAL